MKDNHNDNRTIVILVRHGECQGNREGLFRGRSDFPLNKVGLLQAEELAIEMKLWHPVRIFTSPLSRAKQTALAISKKYHIEIEERIAMNNIELGPWEGKSKEYIAREFPAQWKMWLNEPEKLIVRGMESLDEVQQRTRRDLNYLVEKYSGKTFVIVSHRAVLKPLIASCLGISRPYFWRIHLDTASYSILHFRKRQGYILVQLNQNKHLKEFISEWE